MGLNIKFKKYSKKYRTYWKSHSSSQQKTPLKWSLTGIVNWIQLKSINASSRLRFLWSPMNVMLSTVSFNYQKLSLASTTKTNSPSYFLFWKECVFNQPTERNPINKQGQIDKVWNILLFSSIEKGRVKIQLETSAILFRKWKCRTASYFFEKQNCFCYLCSTPLLCIIHKGSLITSVLGIQKDS